jgi:hypothetical protein
MESFTTSESRTVTNTPTDRCGLKRVVAWLLLLLALENTSMIYVLSLSFPGDLAEIKTGILCGLTGGIGGIVYCLRGVYLNACVRDTWSRRWLPWYFIRPIVSLICGCVSYALIKAGLLILDSAPKTNGTQLGFFVLAFIAGLNVDKFIAKVEDVAQTTWGIEKSRASAPAAGRIPRAGEPIGKPNSAVDGDHNSQ